MWGCGLKYDIAYIMDAMAVVTPYVGVWIEICISTSWSACSKVTPYVGVWIEILTVSR